MTDLASLVLAVDSSQVPTGTAALDGLTAAGGRAEAATKRVGTASISAGAAAARMAAQAQAASRAATSFATGTTAVAGASKLAAYQAQNLAFQINDVVTGLASGQAPMRVFAQQGGQFFQIFQQSGLGVKGFVTQLLSMIGVLKVTRDAQLAEEAANAAAAATAVRSAAQRAAGAIVAADTELALAQAAVRVARTSEAEAAAQLELAAAHKAVAAAAAQATIAEDALAVAQGRASAASAASSARTVIGLGRVGVALGIIAPLAVAAYVGIKSFQDQVARSGEINKFAEGLRLTDSQIEAAGGSVKYLADGTREVTGLTVSFGNIATATYQVLAEAAGLSAKSISDGFTAAFKWIGDFGKFTISILLAGFASLVELLASLAINLGRLATGKIDQLTNPLKDMKDQFNTTFNEVNAGFDKIGNRAKELAEKQLQATSDSNKPPKAPKAKKQSDHGLADALAQLDAQIKGQNALAAAYQVSDAAAIKAEAMQKAEEQAIRHKGEVGIFYEKELALAIAKGAAEGAKRIADLRYEADTRAAVNNMVEAGLVTAAQAGAQLELEAQLRPLAAAAAIAEGDAKTRLVDIMRNLTAASAENNAQNERAQVLADTAAATDHLDRLQLEAQLIGATNKERAVALAQLEAEIYLRDHKGATADEAQRYLEAQKDIARLTADLATAQTIYNDSLSYTADLLSLIDERAQTTASALSNAFGSVGEGIGQALTALTSYAAAQAKFDEDHLAAVKAGISTEKERALYATKSANAQMQAIGGVIGGLKGLFKEHSVGFKAMEAVEKAYAIAQLVRTVASIAPKIAAGAATMFSQLGAFAFPAVAAMVAVMAGLGFAASGGGGGSGPAIPNTDDLQAKQGAGTVLGDSAAKSASIANSLEIVASNTNKDLEYSNAMLRALRNIDFGISKLAGTIARDIQVGNLFDTAALNLGTSTKQGFSLLGGLLGGALGGFLGGKKTQLRELADQGIILSGSPLNLASHYKNQAQWDAAMKGVTGASVASILANGLYGASYTRTNETNTKSGILGIGGGSSSGVDYDTGSLSSSITGLFVQVIGSMRDSIIEASKVIGLDGAEALVNAFQVKIGQISFEGMSGKEIEDQLNAIFSSIGDQMADAVFPALKEMQKVGEGLFETFNRVAREYQIVDLELNSIGSSFGAVGVGSIAARDALVQLFGSLDEFVSQTDFFREQFFSDAEQIAVVQASVGAEMARLGLAGITTRDQFRQAVLGLDLTTAAGRELYASLLGVAPAFDKVLDYFDQLNKKAIQTLQSTVDQFTKFTDSLRKYRDSLFATDSAQGSAYAGVKARFAATAALAASGNATALGGLEGAGRDFLTAAKANASSWLQYQRDVAMVARGVDQGIFAAETTADYAQLQLDALQNATTILGSIESNTAASAAALNAPISQPAAAASSASQTANPDMKALRDEITALRADLNAALQAIAVSAASTDKTLKRWDNGDSARISSDSTEPLNVNLTSWG